MSDQPFKSSADCRIVTPASDEPAWHSGHTVQLSDRANVKYWTISVSAF